MGKKNLRPPATSTDNNYDDTVNSDRAYFNNRAQLPLFVWTNEAYLFGEVSGVEQFFESGYEEKWPETFGAAKM